MGRRLVITAVGALLAMGAVGTPPASAADAYTCSFTIEGYIEPGVGLSPAFNASYTFYGHAACTVNGTAVAGYIELRGGFINATCGTGPATGQAVVQGPDLDLDFSILFNAFVGEIVITGGDAEFGGGSMEILPTDGDCNTGMSQFTGSGAFTALGA